MIQGTTPTHTIHLPFEASTIAAMRLTYEQKGKIVLTKEKDDFEVSGNTIAAKLTQEETLLFDANIQVRIQLHVRTNNGKALATRPWTVPVYILLDRREV